MGIVMGRATDKTSPVVVAVATVAIVWIHAAVPTRPHILRRSLGFKSIALGLLTLAFSIGIGCALLVVGLASIYLLGGRRRSG